MESTAIVPKRPVVGSEDMEKAEVIASGSTDIISTTSTATTTAAIGSVQEESVKQEDVPMEGGEGEVEEEEGETRCICGELDTPDDSGFFIQCEQCSSWQHGYCVSITQDNAPDKYWCEQCRPELHQLFTTDTGEARSIYKPVQEKRRQSRRKARSAAASKSHAANEAEKSPRNTSNTDDNVDDIGDEEDEVEDEASAVALAKDGNTRSSRRRRRNSMDDASTDQYLLDPGDSDKKLLDRKRATFMAREEKQYQRMLEKALKESRRTSHQEDPESYENDADIYQGDTDNHNGTTRLQTDAMLTEGKPDSVTNDDMKESLRPSKEQSMEKTNDVEKEASQEKESSTGSAQDTEKSDEPILPLTSISSSEDDSRKASSRGSKRVSKPARKGNRTRRSNTSSDTNQNKRSADIGTDKPVKPRLPPQRTSLNEMRRRVSAILEFISRTQWELSEDQSDREEFVRFVENQHFVEKVDTIYNGYKESLSMMDDLTRELLLWEKKYSNNTNAIQ
ncbi:CQS_1a_G0053630.mRNA.1.CDS.1 [Saccharomyces cerevisiae]|nr:CQS_1a_G0053630.mRNA.1.CDS.1 [Saccharomyces cerevisiae]CAI7475298.1 CQS_1a_G0053630.mRNA.1.CDS.1 [Saccharomyces cerevisiae]